MVANNGRWQWSRDDNRRAAGQGGASQNGHQPGETSLSSPETPRRPRSRGELEPGDEAFSAVVKPSAAAISKAIRRKFLDYVAAGLSLRHAAALVRCRPQAILEAARRDKEFRRQVMRARVIGEAMPLVQLIRASRRSWRAAAVLLEQLQSRTRARRNSENGK